MGFCVNCGRELKDDDVFCPKCGTQNDAAVKAGPAAIPAVESAAVPADKEESLAFADKLFKKYKDLERTNKEIEDVRMRLAIPVESTPKQHAAFRYFWPFLVYAAVSFGIFYTIGTLLTYASAVTGALFMLIGLISIPVLLITGGVRAVRYREEMNAGEYRNHIRRKEQQELDKKNSDTLYKKRQRAMDDLKKYDPIIPRDLRNSAAMSKVKVLMQAGKAENFTEAIEILKK